MSLAGGSFASLALALDENAPFNRADALETFEMPADLGNLLEDWPANVGMLSVGVGSLNSLGMVASVRAGAPEEMLHACALCFAPRPKRTRPAPRDTSDDARNAVLCAAHSAADGRHARAG